MNQETDTVRCQELAAQFPFLEMGQFLFVLFGMELILSVWMARRQKNTFSLNRWRLKDKITLD